MKTIIKFAVFSALTIGSLLHSSNAFGNNSSYSGDRLSLAMEFFKTDTVVVVTPDNFRLTDSNKMEIECYKNFSGQACKPAYKFLKESDLKPSDYYKHILLYGSFRDFTNKNFLNIPVKKTLFGFKFKDTTFSGPNDAFYYINTVASRMYICKNSQQSSINIFSMGIGAYPLHVFRGNEVVYTGIIVK